MTAAYGVLFRPPGLTDEELFLGLLANLPRIRAAEALTMRRAIVSAIEGDASGLLADAGGSPREVGSARLRAWTAEQIARRMQSWR